MRIPHTIEKSTLLAYNVLGDGKSKYATEADFPTLAELCTESLPTTLLPVLPVNAKNYMLEILPTTLPLPLAAKIIPSGVYWKRRAEERWKTTAVNVQEADGDWKRFYIEKHVQDVLEGLSPDNHAEEELKALCTVASEFVERLELRQLQVQSRFLDPDTDEDDLGEPRERINLKTIITHLENLVELHIQFSIRNLGSNYRTILFEFTAQDCRYLGDGITKSTKLRLLRIHRSLLNDDKLIILLSHLQANVSLEALEFPHCHIGDEGAAALAKFISNRPKFRKLDLSNNKIKKLGIQALSFVLTQQNGCALVELNVGLNLFQDEGAQFLLSALQRQAPAVRVLNISSAGLGEDTGMLLGEMLARNKCLVDLNVSSNSLGAHAGTAILQGINNNTSLQFCDLRMTGINDQEEAMVEALLHRNRCHDRTVQCLH